MVFTIIFQKSALKFVLIEHKESLLSLIASLFYANLFDFITSVYFVYKYKYQASISLKLERSLPLIDIDSPVHSGGVVSTVMGFARISEYLPIMSKP